MNKNKKDSLEKEQASTSARESLVRVREAHSLHAHSLLQIPGVIAVSIGRKVKGGVRTDRLAVRVSVQVKRPLTLVPPEQRIPTELTSEGGALVETDVDEMEMPSAPLPRMLRTDSSAAAQPGAGKLELRLYRRPVLGGLSASSIRFSIGTIAIPVCDSSQPGILYLLSNNHVFAFLNAGRVGDAILQPAPEDGGTYPASIIARLTRWIPLQLGIGSTNTVDAALAYVPTGYALPTVTWVGQPTQTRPASDVHVGDLVRKVGRTTGLTSGEIIGIAASVKVNYALAGFGNKQTTLVDQILTSPMAGYGDSGSLLLDTSNYAVGMLAAGSRTATVFNYFQNVATALNVTLAQSHW